MSVARENHIASINSLLVKYGAVLDRYGTYKLGDYKFDTRAINLKIFSGRFKIKSIPMNKLTLESLEKLLKVYAKEEEN